MRTSFRKWANVSLYLGSALVVLGFTCLYSCSYLLDYIIEKSLELEDGSTSYKEWQSTRPLTMDIYMFNWTNPDDIYNPKIKPNFVEVGPYRFIHVREKVNITWNKHNETVTYKQLFRYSYVDDSPGNYSDVITTINMVAWSAAQQTKDAGFFKKESAKAALFFAPIYVRKTVRELLFDGYVDPLISVANFASVFTGEDIPDKFGWFYTRNGSIGESGVYNVRTTPDEEFGVVKAWNYERRIPFYKGDCGKVHGSASEFYPRHLKPDHITYFCTELCRVLEFTYESNVTVKGIPSYKYSAKDKVFDNGTTVKENACYCNDDCLPSGVIDISGCSRGLPMYSSLPHFYYADSSYVDAVEGMKPEKDKHEFYFSLEPSVGVITSTAARVQLNLLLEPLPDYSLFRNVPKIMFPVFWTDHIVTLYDDHASNMRLLLAIPQANIIFSTITIIIGVACVITAIFHLFYKEKKTIVRRLTKEEIPLKQYL